MTVAPQSEPPLLAMREHHQGISRRRRAEGHRLRFAARRSARHLGENGAGKSTLVKILSGAVAPTQGELSLDGQRIQIAGPADARRYGIAMVYQETSLVPSMSVAQNLYLGDEKFFNRLRGTYIEAQQLFQSLNFPVDPTAIVQSLGTAKRQMVEIARAVRLKAKIIIFDEPTATLTPEEKHYLFALIDRLRKEQVSIIFISHALEEALEISDRITILRDGAHVMTGDAKTFSRETIVRHMVGRSLSNELYGRAADGRAVRRAGEKILSVQNLSMQNFVRNTSFSIFAGQITGIFGLVGSGRTETAKIIAGVAKRDFFHGGDVRLGGKPGALPDAAPGGRRRRRLRHRGPQERGPVRDDVGRGKHLYRTNFEPRVARNRDEHERDARTRRQLDEEDQCQDAEQRRAGRRAVRRQSTEGGHRQGAGPEAQAGHLRRADARRRRRRHR